MVEAKSIHQQMVDADPNRHALFNAFDNLHDAESIRKFVDERAQFIFESKAMEGDLASIRQKVVGDAIYQSRLISEETQKLWSEALTGSATIAPAVATEFVNDALQTALRGGQAGTTMAEQDQQPQ